MCATVINTVRRLVTGFAERNPRKLHDMLGRGAEQRKRTSPPQRNQSGNQESNARAKKLVLWQ